MKFLEQLALITALTGAALAAAAYTQPALHEYLALGIKIALGAAVAWVVVHYFRVSGDASSHLRK